MASACRSSSPSITRRRAFAALHARICKIAAVLAAERGLACEIVYVDDGSRDASLAAALALPAQAVDVQVVSLSRNFGKEAALLAGLDHARLGAVLFMDADGQHPPALIETLVGHWLDGGYDVVYTAKAHRDNESIADPARREGVLFPDQLGRAPADPRGCRRLPPAVAARRGGAAADARAQSLLQGPRQLDRLPPVPRRLRAGRAHPWAHHLEPRLADRALGRGADLVLGGAAADREPARHPAGGRARWCSASGS